MTCKDCICSEVCYYKSFNDVRNLEKRRNDVEKIPKEQREKIETHLRKNPDRQGLYWFKKKSPIQKEWEEMVTAYIDFKRLEQVDFWWLSYVLYGKYSMWDMDGEIYGYLEDGYQKDIKPDDFMEQIKISEYYAAIERFEDGN